MGNTERALSSARVRGSLGVCGFGSYTRVVDDTSKAQCCEYNRLFEREVSHVELSRIFTSKTKL